MKPGDTVDGRYVVERHIGRGAMADVFAVHDYHTGTNAALKVLHSAVSRDPQAIQRFAREAQAQSMIEHKNVARTYGSGVTRSGEPYLLLELLRGYSLRDVVKGCGPVPVIRACSYAWQALQGLAAAHGRGIVHRDLKPANLMLEPSPGPVERVCVIDFGFASLEGSARLTRQGEVVGSLSYMAPERLKGAEAREASDLYAVACILYEALVGRRPFDAASDYLLVQAHVGETPVPPRAANPHANIPPEVEEVVLRGLSKSPTERFPSAADMAHALELAAQRYVGT